MQGSSFLQMELHAVNSKFDRASWKTASSLKSNRYMDNVIKRQIKLLSTRRHYMLDDSQFTEVIATISSILPHDADPVIAAHYPLLSVAAINRGNERDLHESKNLSFQSNILKHL